MGRIKELALTQREEHSPRTTLGDLAQAGVDIFCWCNRCGHSAAMPADLACAQYGPALPVADVGVHVRCTGCGGKDVATRPHWPSLDQVTQAG